MHILSPGIKLPFYVFFDGAKEKLLFGYTESGYFD
jgi:hypothetical protein